MPRKSCALIGPGAGPKVPLGGGSGGLKVSGLREGENFVFRKFHGTRVHEETHSFGKADLLLFGDCDFVQVLYNGKSKHFIACVLTGI